MFDLITGLWVLCVVFLTSIAAFVWDELRDGDDLDLGSRQEPDGPVANRVLSDADPA